MRRLRQSPWIRELVAETHLSVRDLIWPVFVHEEKANTPVAALPGVQRFSVSGLVEAAKQAHDAGIPALAIFPVVPASKKSDDAAEALNQGNLICHAIAAIKKEVPGIGIIADVALDPYTVHGHDGIVIDGDVANDETVAVLCDQALVLAQAGADIVAPSDMMDGRVAAMRDALDDADFVNTSILSYTAKYASAFYGPFRDAVGSKSSLGKADKRTYQMNPANAREALLEAELDTFEGADMLMVKPGTLYLDIIAKLREASLLPVLAYHVSGEYAMVKLAAEKGLIDGDAAMLESLICMKRAGAQAILTYAALDIATQLKA